MKKNISPSKPKVLVILGTTSAGKTSLAVRLARLFRGEIISADSRQVYRGLDVGTGKDLDEYGAGKNKIPYHLIDVADPRRRFHVARFQRLAIKAIGDVLERKKLPIVVGGSGLYLQALIDNFKLAAAKISPIERSAWAKLPAAELLRRIKRFKPEFAERLNNSDRNNIRRLVRYLEIVSSGGEAGSRKETPYDWLVLGLDIEEETLRARIRERLHRRLEKEGLVTEVENLRRSGLSWKKLKAFGLEYKFVSQFLTGELSYPIMVERLDAALWRFSKRQLTWFRRWEKQGRKIEWVGSQEGAMKIIKKWL